MKKRLFSILLALSLALTLLATTALAETPVSVTVSSFTTGSLGAAIDAQLGSTVRNDVTDLTVSGGVLNTDDWATMKNMTGLVRVDLSGATCVDNEIPTEAFNNYNSNNPTEGPKYKLTTLVFPSGITTIQNGAFAFCKNLTFSSANWLPETVTTINPLAFQDCSAITGVDLSHVTTLGRQAFQRTGLTGTLTLPDNLLLLSNKNLDNFYIFDGCTGITEIVIGSGITSKGSTSNDPEEAVAYLGGNLFSGTSVTKLTIPGDITYLGSLGKIDGCELEVQSGVQYFGYYPTNGDKAATEVISGTVTAVSLPDSIKEISSDALKEGISVKKIEYHGTAAGAGKMTLIDRGTKYLETIDLSGSGTTEFSTNGKAAEGKLATIDLSNCTALTSASVVSWRSNGVMNLLGCTALTSVTLGSNNDGSWCENYTLLLSSKPADLNGANGVDKGIALVTNGGTFPENATFSYSALATPTRTGHIFCGWYNNAAFGGEAVTTATKGTVYYANWLATSGTCGDHATWALTQNNTDAANPTYTLTISGTGAMKDYTVTTGTNPSDDRPWSACIASITELQIADGITYIGSRTCSSATSLESCTIPASVQEIGSDAFSTCTSLQSIQFSENGELKTIGNGAFWGCESLTGNLTIPNSVETIGTYAFQKAGISSLTLGNSVKEIGNYAFSTCPNLTGALVLPDSVEVLGQRCFNTTPISSVTFGSGLTTIGSAPFARATNQNKVPFNNGSKKFVVTSKMTSLAVQALSGLDFDTLVIESGSNVTFAKNTFQDLSYVHSIVLTNSELPTFAPLSINGHSETLIIYGMSDSIKNAIKPCTNTPGDGTTEEDGALIYTAKPIYAVTNGGIFPENTTFSNSTLATPTRTGYAFVGWYDNAAFDGEAVTAATKGEVYYAKWQRLNVVTFNANGGTVDPASAYVDTDGKLMLSALPAATRAGYRFLGWYTEATGGEQISLDRSYTADTTVYAQWQLIPGVSLPVGNVNVSGSLNGSVSVDRDDARQGSIVTVTVAPNAGSALDALSVVDASGNVIPVTHVGGNKYSFVMPATDVTVRASFTSGTATGFVDVPADKYFYNAVNWAVANGITSGVDATHFAPYASCTRGQLVTFLWRAAGCPAAKATENAFGDVKETSSFYKAILWAAENGIVTGYDDGTFKPNAAVSRQQTAAILYRYAKFAGMDVSVGEDTNILSFNDALSVSEYAISAFQWATGAQVITGNGANLLPYDTCTRAQIVTMLYRLLAK